METFRVEVPYLIEDIESIIQGGDYDETFLPDFGDCVIRFDPPNAIFNEDFVIPLLELKMLLEEWIQFMKK